MRYSIPLLAGVPVRQPIRGRCIVLMDLGGADGVEMALESGSTQDVESFGEVGRNFSLFAQDKQFTGLILTSTVNTTAEVIVSDYRIEALDGQNLVMSLDVDQIPLPVEPTRGDAPGNPFYVTGITYTDTPAATNHNNAAVAVGDAVVLALAANVDRLEARFTNIGTDPVALGAAGLTWATRTIILNPGDTWVEVKGAALAWYAITDAAGSASVTVQELRA